ETGSRVAVPIWVAYMGKVLGDSSREDFPVPDRVVIIPVDLDPSNECVRVVPMAFVRGSEPSVACGRRPPPAARPAAPTAPAPPGGRSPRARGPGPPPPPLPPRPPTRRRHHHRPRSEIPAPGAA